MTPIWSNDSFNKLIQTIFYATSILKFTSSINPHFRNDFLIISAWNSFHVACSHFNTSLLGGVGIFPDPLLSEYSDTFHAWQISANRVLKGFIIPTSEDWHADLKTPGIWITCIPCSSNASIKSVCMWISISSRSRSSLHVGIPLLLLPDAQNAIFHPTFLLHASIHTTCTLGDSLRLSINFSLFRLHFIIFIFCNLCLLAVILMLLVCSASSRIASFAKRSAFC